MKHGATFRKLGRNSDHRQALLKNMATSLIKHERIKTTVPKAKELRRFADWMVTYAKYDNKQHGMSLAQKYIRSPVALNKLFDELAPRYENRPGGYTRVVKIGNRRGDSAPMAIIEFVDREGEIRKAAKVDENTVKRNRGLLDLLDEEKK